MGIELHNVTKSFGQKLMLQAFSHSFPNSGTIALLGPSGCGKTTLLRLIAGLELPDSGSILMPPHSKLSMMFQEDRLLDSVDVFTNVLAVLPGKGAQSRQLAWDCLARCGLEQAGEQYPTQLSGGMRRRVALARAMAFGGNILLLDEPFKGLDVETKKQVQGFVFDPPLAKGRMTLLITHDIDEARAVADTILFLDGIPLRLLKEQTRDCTDT